MSAVTIRRWLQRPYAALLVWVVLAANLFGLAHEASTTHVRCEHGDVVHVDGNVASSLTITRLDHDSTFDGAAQAMHEHQHCGMVGATRQLVAPADQVAEVSTVVHASVPNAPDHAAIATASELYRTAPKTSPPG